MRLREPAPVEPSRARRIPSPACAAGARSPSASRPRRGRPRRRRSSPTYLAHARRPTSCRSRPCSSRAGRSPRRTSARPASAGRRSRGAVLRRRRRRRRRAAPRPTTGRPTSALAVADVLEAAGHAPDAGGDADAARGRRDAFAAIEAASGAGGARPSCSRPARACRSADRGCDRQGAVAASSASGSARGSSRRRIAKAFDRPLDAVKRAGMLTGDIGRTADAGARRTASATPSMALFHPLKFMLASPAEDAAEIVRRLGPTVWVEDKYDGIRCPAPPARRRGPALLARPPRHQRPVPRGRRGRARSCRGTGSSTARCSPSATASCCRSSSSRRGSGARTRRRRSSRRSR